LTPAAPLEPPAGVDGASVSLHAGSAKRAEQQTPAPQLDRRKVDIQLMLPGAVGEG